MKKLAIKILTVLTGFMTVASQQPVSAVAVDSLQTSGPLCIQPSGSFWIPGGEYGTNDPGCRPGTGLKPVTPYSLPYSLTGNSYDWHRLWVNTAVLSGAFVGTLLVLECLPEDATTWNRAELQDVPLFKRWHKHVIKKGPEWDHDKFYFNYILHPYAGAAYFMAARSCGFNFWRSALYGSIVSTVGWEFGIEAFMERPSIQDIFVTPIAGSIIGEGFYRVKRWLTENDFRILGSRILGGVVAFLVDPVNEFTGLWLGNPAREAAHASSKTGGGLQISFRPAIGQDFRAFSLVRQF